MFQFPDTNWWLVYQDEQVGYWPATSAKSLESMLHTLILEERFRTQNQAVFTHPHKWAVAIFQMKVMEELVLFGILGTLTKMEPL